MCWHCCVQTNSSQHAHITPVRPTVENDSWYCDYWPCCLNSVVCRQDTKIYQDSASASCAFGRTWIQNLLERIGMLSLCKQGKHGGHFKASKGWVKNSQRCYGQAEICFSNGKVRVSLEDCKWQTNSLTLEINNSDTKFPSVVQTFHLSCTPLSPCEGVSLPGQSGVRKTVTCTCSEFSSLRLASPCFQSTWDSSWNLQSMEISLKGHRSHNHPSHKKIFPAQCNGAAPVIKGHLTAPSC